jgi:hypothetical protein
MFTHYRPSLRQVETPDALQPHWLGSFLRHARLAAKPEQFVPTPFYRTTAVPVTRAANVGYHEPNYKPSEQGQRDNDSSGMLGLGSADDFIFQIFKKIFFRHKSHNKIQQTATAKSE